MMPTGIIQGNNHFSATPAMASNFCKNERNVMASNLFSRLVTKVPSLQQTAPNTPVFFRVGACRRTGSTSSDGIHIAQRDPCCWKWHSSSNQRSMSFLTARRRSFFKPSLCRRVGVSNNGAWFAPTESQLMKQPLTLPDAQVRPEPLGQMMTQEFSIPKILGVSQLTWGVAQVSTEVLTDTGIQCCWTPGTLYLLQASESAFLKAMNPVLYRARAVPESDDFGIFDFQFAHNPSFLLISIAEKDIIRTYLCRHI